MGYVGLSLGLLLSKRNKVIFIDIDESKIKDVIDNKEKDFFDIGKNKFDQEELINFDNIEAFEDTSVFPLEEIDFCIIALPTNFNETTNSFDVELIKNTISDILSKNDKCLIVIKSTIPVGFIDSCREEFNTDRIVFSPEFLREGSEIYDNLYPSRLIIGGEDTKSKVFLDLLDEVSINKPPKLFMGAKEAESVKLFSNSYLAMRVAFFNELDNFAVDRGLDTKSIIKGVSEDPRIGDHYNNPSFGFGGYCLPKDLKQLVNTYHDTPNELLASVLHSNEKRKSFICSKIKSQKVEAIGIYRLIMKKDSDNFRESAIIDIINELVDSEKKVLIYEPLLEDDHYLNCKVIKDFDRFINLSELIIVNRHDKRIANTSKKIFTSDIFNED